MTAGTTGLRAANWLLDNDFRVLGVTARDTSARIMDAASDPLLTVGSERCDRARRNLTNPRARLGSEVAWLPGVSPARAAKIVGKVSARPVSAEVAKLPSLARANVLLASLAERSPESAEDAQVEVASALAAVRAVDGAEVLRDINEDRSVAGVPPVRSEASVVEALEAQNVLYLGAIKDYLDQLATADLVAAISALTTSETQSGSVLPSPLLARLLDIYEIEALEYLRPEADAIIRLCEAILANASKGEAHLQPAVDRLVEALTEWDAVAQPLQLVRLAQGERHAISHELAGRVRSICISLVNEHHHVAIASTITETLSDLFAEVSDLSELFQDDVDALDDLRSSIEVRAANAVADSYSAKIGLAQTLLSISPTEIVWGERRFKVDAVDSVRWGSTRHSINGIPTGTTHLMAFTGREGYVEFTTRSTEVFREFTDRLWRLCGVPILISTLGRLKSGETLKVGSIEFRDESVTLSKSKIFGRPDLKSFDWGDVVIWSESGEFCIAGSMDRSFQARASYQSHPNVHVLANLLGLAFKRGIVKLSDTLN